MKGYIGFEDDIQVAIFDDSFVYAIHYFPLSKIGINDAMSFLSGVKDLELTILINPNITSDPGDDLVLSEYGDKEVTISESDYDLMSQLIKLVNPVKYNIITIMNLIEELDNGGCYLFHSAQNIYCTVKTTTFLEDIHAIPFSNYNLYLNRIYKTSNFDYLVNMDTYSDDISCFKNADQLENHKHLCTLLIASQKITGFILDDLHDAVFNIEEVNESTSFKKPIQNGKVMLHKNETESVTENVSVAQEPEVSRKAKPEKPKRRFFR